MSEGLNANARSQRVKKPVRYTSWLHFGASNGYAHNLCSQTVRLINRALRTLPLDSFFVDAVVVLKRRCVQLAVFSARDHGQQTKAVCKRRHARSDKVCVSVSGVLQSVGANDQWTPVAQGQLPARHM
jgi:hypothetical protein